MKIKNTNEIAPIIRQRRKALGITQKQLAESAGCFQSNIQRFETGKQTPAMAVILKIFKALNLTLVLVEDEILDNNQD